MTTQQTLWPTPARPRSLAERPLGEWPAQERPLERMHEVGAASLSDTELLALILGSCGKTNPVALAGELLAHAGGWRGLQKLTLAEISAIPGISRSKAASVKAALEVGRRLHLASPDERLQIRSPADAAHMLMTEMSHLDQEHLRTVILQTIHMLYVVLTSHCQGINAIALSGTKCRKISATDQYYLL